MFLLLYIMMLCSPPNATLQEVRNTYGECSKSEKLCDKMLAQLNNTTSAELLGYKACLTMMKASWATWPNQKLAYFNDGKMQLEKAIKAHPTNIELRYLRYSVQKAIPSYLDYDNMATDLAFLKKNVASLTDLQLKKMIENHIK